MDRAPERLALFCSGGGTNAQAIIDYFRHNERISVCCLLANRPDAYALERARKEGIPTMAFDKATLNDTTKVDRFLAANGATALVLAGFLWLVPQRLLAAYPGRVVNIHPALLPDFGGKGMYGRRVHEAVSQSGRTETGITIHLADAEYDKGGILHQEKTAIAPGEAPERIEEKIHPLEWHHYPRVIEQWLDG